MQVDVNLVEQELQAAAAVEAELRSALAALQRDYDTASVLTISLQEQLRDRDQRVRFQFGRVSSVLRLQGRKWHCWREPVRLCKCACAPTRLCACAWDVLGCWAGVH